LRGWNNASVLPPPEFAPSPRELDDLELLLRGALTPLTGFAAPDSGITLHVPPAVAEHAITAGSLRLTDAEGAPLADLQVTGSYSSGDAVGLIGPVHALAPRGARPFERFYQTPAEVRRDSAEMPSVPVEQPLTADDLGRIAAEANGRAVLLLPLVGERRPRGVSAAGLIRATLAAATLLPRAEVVAVPLAAREDAAADARLREKVLGAYTTGPVIEPSGAGELPDPVGDAVRRDRPIGTGRGLVVLFTGLSGSGKSTIARGVRNALVEAGERTVTLLDGDVVRRHLSAGLGFSRADRDTNIRRIGWVAAEISRHGGTAVASPIAPFAATREAVREMVGAAGGAFLLVHVATPLAECERRDRKGLYARARAGEIPDFTGISSPYEDPADADLRIDTTGRSVADAVAEVLTELRRRGLIS
jgi:sulfate adenylyltransferase